MQPWQLPSNHHQGRALPSLVLPTKSNNIMNKRTIKHIFVHCTATLPTATVESIQQGWKAIGWSNPGYHYIVKADGTIIQLQPEDKAANGVKGYNATAIHVAYIGGIGLHKANPRDVGSAHIEDTRTPAQKAALRALLADIHSRYSKAVILGHRSIWGEYSPEKWQKVCPCFNAIKEYADI
nr:MAG TPA: endodeoxyribonuclease I [Caudoviricetes sp.]